MQDWCLAHFKLFLIRCYVRPFVACLTIHDMTNDDDAGFTVRYPEIVGEANLNLLTVTLNVTLNFANEKLSYLRY